MKAIDLRHCDVPFVALADEQPEFAELLASVEREPLPERLLVLAIQLQAALGQHAVVAAAGGETRRFAVT